MARCFARIDLHGCSDRASSAAPDARLDAAQLQHAMRHANHMQADNTKIADHKAPCDWGRIPSPTRAHEVAERLAPCTWHHVCPPTALPPFRIAQRTNNKENKRWGVGIVRNCADWERLPQRSAPAEKAGPRRS
eukprot:gene11261-biopygen15402